MAAVRVACPPPAGGVSTRQLLAELRNRFARGGSRYTYERISAVHATERAVVVHAHGLDAADQETVRDLVAAHSPYLAEDPVVTELERDVESLRDRVAELVDRLDAEEKYAGELADRLEGAEAQIEWMAKVIAGLQAALAARPDP